MPRTLAISISRRAAGAARVETPDLEDAKSDRTGQLDPRSRAALSGLAVSPSAAIKLMRRLLATGSAAPARYGGHRRRVLGRYEADLRRLVEAMPDLTLPELRTDLERRSGAGVSTIRNALCRIGRSGSCRTGSHVARWH
jgi:hypothetical protein